MTSKRLITVVVALVVLLLQANHSPGAALAASCTFQDGFKVLRDQIPNIVGDCLANEATDLASEDTQQQTTSGLLVWRKADNWTAFTDGATTWINGPFGVQVRANDARFSWEQGGSAASGEHPILALYYPWYDPGAFGNASDQPAIGPYLSDDPGLIQTHVKQARSAGIDGFVSAWLGQGDRTDQNFDKLLDTAQQKGFTATIYFETDHFLPWGPQDVAEQLGNFYRDHLDHPALVHYQGKPVIFFWRTSALGLGTWASIRQQVDPQHRAVWIAEGDVFGQLAGDTFDGIHPYSTAWSGNPAATLASYGQRAHAYPGKLWVPSAMPGYDDTRVRGGFAVPRNGGAYYQASFQGAVDSGPDWAILITSWNEWQEGHQIEPSASYGNLYLDLTAQLVAQFRSR